MFDIKLIREDKEAVSLGLESKNTKVDLDNILSLDEKRRSLIAQADELKNKKNRVSAEIGKMIRAKQDAKSIIASMKETSTKISSMEAQIKELDEELKYFLDYEK